MKIETDPRVRRLNAALVEADQLTDHEFDRLPAGELVLALHNRAARLRMAAEDLRWALHDVERDNYLNQP